MGTWHVTRAGRRLKWKDNTLSTVTPHGAGHPPNGRGNALSFVRHKIRRSRRAEYAVCICYDRSAAHAEALMLQAIRDMLQTLGRAIARPA